MHSNINSINYINVTHAFAQRVYTIYLLLLC